MKQFFTRSLIVLSFPMSTISLFVTTGIASTTIALERASHFLTTDGSNILIPPGTYTIEAAEEWLRLIPGERRDAWLLEAVRTCHDKNLKRMKA